MGGRTAPGARTHRRPRPRLGRPRRHRRCRGAVGDGPGPAPAGDHLLPAHGPVAARAGDPALRGPRARLDAIRAGRRGGAAGVQPRGPVHRARTQGRPRPGAAAHAREHRPGRRGRLAGRAADHDDRPRAARCPGAHRAAGRPRDRPVHRSLGGDAGGGPRRLPRSGDQHPEDDDPPVQRHDRRGPPPPRSRRRGAHGRRRVRRAGRGRVPRPSRPVADHPALQAGRPAHPRQRRDVARRDAATGRGRSGAWTWS